MPVATMTCRVCGNTYKACRTPKPSWDAFRWQDVACSPECGSKYFHDIMVSRGQIQETPSDDGKESDAKPVRKTRKSSANKGDFDNA